MCENSWLERAVPPAVMKFRVSFINFLNSVPLGWGFLQGSYRDTFQLLFDVPSECARHLESGQADVGLIPVIEYQRIGGLRVLPEISISSKREVRSVLFVCSKPLLEVRRVAVDTSSRTSAALLEIILRTFYRRDEIVFEPHRPEPAEMLEKYDAALIIGNPALRVPNRPLHVVDLAAEWNRFTGLPFVFAVWAVRAGVELGEAASVFYASRREGLEQLDGIARSYSERLGLPREEVEVYLREHLDYGLDGENLRGLETFFQLAGELGLIEAPRPLRFYPVPAGVRGSSPECR